MSDQEKNAPKTKDITIQGVMVNLSLPYTEGHTITAAEASALNQTRAENIGNNARRKIKEMLEAEGATPESVAKAAQKLVSEYDKEYVFTLASVGGSARLDPLTKECRAIARNYIGAKLKEMGVTQAAYLEKNGPDAIKEKIIELAEQPAVVEAAKKALAEKDKIAGITL